jgi:hypothetical protein
VALHSSTRRPLERGTKERENNVGRMTGRMKGGKGRRKYVKNVTSKAT